MAPVPENASDPGTEQHPAPHVAVPVQAWPQLPQFFGSVCSSTHALPHAA
jgi:hypothetical protein